MEHYLHVFPGVLYIWKLQKFWTLIFLSQHSEGLWQEEVRLDPSGQTMKQILWEQGVNGSKDSRK